MVLKKWSGNFRLEHSVRKKQDYLFRCSVAPGNLPLERPKKLCSIYFPTGFCGNLSYKWSARMACEINDARERGGHTCEKKGRRGRPALIGALNRFLVPQNSHFQIEAIQLENGLGCWLRLLWGAGTLLKNTTKILSWLSLCNWFWHRMLYFTQYKNSSLGFKNCKF